MLCLWKKNASKEIKEMTTAVRIECPKCRWGFKYKDSHINQGFLKAKCKHCSNLFFFKITLTGVNVEVFQDKPDAPVHTLKEAKQITNQRPY